MNRSNAADLPKAKTPEERQEIIEMGSKQKNAYNNPCVKVRDVANSRYGSTSLYVWVSWISGARAFL